MSKSKDSSLLPASLVPSQEIFPGVRVTRRIALQNSAAALLLMALGASGCAGEQEQNEDEESDEDDREDAESNQGDDDEKSGRNKKKGKGKSKGKKKDNEGEDNDEGDDDNDGEPEGDKKDGKEGGDKEPEDKGGNDGSKDDKGNGNDEGDDKEPEDNDTSPLSLDEIVAMLVDDANKLVKDKSISEADYQKKVGKLLARLDKKAKIPKLNPGRVHNMRRIAGKSPIHIFVMEMAPNAKIPLHDHGNRIGNILGWRGSIKTTNYTKVEGYEPPAKDGSFLLQHSDSRTIKKGDTGHLARVEHNFHIVQAGPQGATLLDMFTYYDESKAGVPGAGSRFVRLGQVVDREKKIYRASYSSRLAHLTAHEF